MREDLAALGRRYGLDPAVLCRLEALVSFVSQDPRPPTTVTEPPEVIERHIADSLVALDLGCVHAANAIADIGAGPGFPGLALAAARSESHVFLVESVRRKCEFIRGAVAAADLHTTKVVESRVEAWGEGVEALDVVTARAVAPLPVVAEYAAPLLRVGGTLVAWKGRRDPAEERATELAAAELGLGHPRVHAVSPFAGARDRHLHELTKVSPTPPRFPRRPGVARKRPLAHG